MRLTINEAVCRFNVFLEDRATPLLPPDVRKTVSKSNRAGYESLLEIYRETDLSQEKVCVLGSLASSPDPDVVREALNLVLSPEVTWTCLKENRDYIAETSSGRILTYFISVIVSLLNTYKGDEAEEFFKTRTKASIPRTVKQSIESED